MNSINCLFSAVVLALALVLTGCDSQPQAPAKMIWADPAVPFEQRVQALVMEQLRLTNAPKATDRLAEDLGADSLACLELAVATEAAFGIPVPYEETEKLKTVGDLVKFLEQAAPVTLTGVIQMRLVQAEASPESELLTPITTKLNARPERLHVEKRVLLDQSAVKIVAVTTDDFGFSQINIEFTDDGSKAFAAITKTNLNRQLAIILEGRLFSAPKILAEITGGQAIINGDFTKEEAKTLARKINEQLKR
jgi:acyl carrier protein